MQQDYSSQPKPIAAALRAKRFTLQPRYTTVIHQVRKQLELSMPAYCVVDSVSKLSNKPDHEWCTRSKDDLAGFLMISRRTVFNALNEAVEKGLIEKNDRGDLRATNKWIEMVELYRSEDVGHDRDR
jgi:hypothetical protein